MTRSDALLAKRCSSWGSRRCCSGAPMRETSAAANEAWSVTMSEAEKRR